MCDAVEGRILTAPDVSGLREAARLAETEGADAVFLADGPLGDAIVLAAGLSTQTTRILLGIQVQLTEVAHRHPSVLARDLTTFDHVCGGRSVLSFTAPFTDGVAEAVTLCRDMWLAGTAVSTGPRYPVAGAVNRPRPISGHSPLVALDLAGGAAPPDALMALVDLLLEPTDTGNHDHDRANRTIRRMPRP